MIDVRPHRHGAIDIHAEISYTVTLLFLTDFKRINSTVLASVQTVKVKKGLAKSYHSRCRIPLVVSYAKN